MDEKTRSSYAQQYGATPTSNSLSLVPDDVLLAKLESTENLQKVLREGIIIICALPASVLLQMAMPGLARGVDNHSNFAYRPLRRLDRTLAFLYCMAFGTKEEKRVMIEAVNRTHARVQGADYSADDPDLQMWVAATGYAMIVGLYEEVFGPMEASKADGFYQEASVFAESLRVPSGVWPRDRKAFWKYWDAKVATLQITPQAHNVANDMLYNKSLPLWLWPILPIVRLTTTYMLPATLQQGYGLNTSQLRQATYNVLMAGFRFTYPVMPEFIRSLPMNYYMRQMRQQVAKKKQ